MNELSAVGQYEMHRFEKYNDLKIQVRGHSRSLEMKSFNRSYMTIQLMFNSICGSYILYRFETFISKITATRPGVNPHTVCTSELWFGQEQEGILPELLSSSIV